MPTPSVIPCLLIGTSIAELSPLFEAAVKAARDLVDWDDPSVLLRDGIEVKVRRGDGDRLVIRPIGDPKFLISLPRYNEGLAPDSPAQLARSWSQSVSRAVDENSTIGSEFLGTLLEAAAVAAVAWVAAGGGRLEGEVICAADSTVSETQSRFFILTDRNLIAAPPLLDAYLAERAPPFRALTMEYGMLGTQTFRRWADPADVGPMEALRRLAEMPSSIIEEMRCVIDCIPDG